MDITQLDDNRGGMLQLKRYEEMLVQTKPGNTRHNEPLQAVIENKLHASALQESNTSILERNRALLQYIATLANSNSNTDKFNYEFVDSLLHGGAVINTADQYEQTIFHEVARSWNIDVARFLLKRGCHIDKKDSFGRTPLHVASAVDYSEMVEFLLQNNADIDARTLGDGQAPIHYAAKNGALRSLKMLLGFNAAVDSLDSKNRTALQLAAEWTRSGTAKVLLDEGASSCILDTSGNSALCVLIDRIPHLALDALKQLHSRDIITMSDYYFLQYLEASRENIETMTTRTPLETAVATRKYEVVTHPVMQRLIHNKWIQFGRYSTLFDILFHVLFWFVWTSISLGTPRDGAKLYNPRNLIWRIVLGVFALLMTIFNVWKLSHETFKSQQSQKSWITWRLGQLKDDLLYCHPRWPQEQKYVKYEIKRVKSLPVFNAFGAWFYFDWFIIMIIFITIAAHFSFHRINSAASRYVYMHSISIGNLLVGLRILKYIRPFPGIGTLVIILGETSGDFVNWAFLFLLFLVPLSAAFWINFGNLSLHIVRDFNTATGLLYSVFRMSVGDDFNLEGLIKADPVMSRILVVLTLTTLTIVTLNLLIALLSDTFSRVHNNAVANTIMQRAIKVVEAERALKGKFKLKYKEFMKTNCSPEVLPMTVDKHNSENQSRRAENQMHANLENMKKILDERFSKVYGENKMSDFDAIVSGVKNLRDPNVTISNDLAQINELVKSLITGEDNKPPKTRRHSSRKESGSPRDDSGSISKFFGRLVQPAKEETVEQRSGGYKRRSSKKKDRDRGSLEDHNRKKQRKSIKKQEERRSKENVNSERSMVPYNVAQYEPLVVIPENRATQGINNIASDEQNDVSV